MTTAHVLGFPRIGARRELKAALEAFWSGTSSEAELRAVGAELRKRHWRLQIDAGLDALTVGDFAWYDHVHNATCLFGALPARFAGGGAELADYFAMARGTRSQPALALRKWFDTNYHYLVPELSERTEFRLNPQWLLPEIDEAVALGHPIKVALVGPLTWLWLADTPAGCDKLQLLPALVREYAVLGRELRARGVQWVQLDEPLLALDVPAAWLAALKGAYETLCEAAPAVMLATYFGSVAEHAHLLKRLPIGGLHVDLVRSPSQLESLLPGWPADKVLSLGVIDGRNVWRSDLHRALATLRKPHIVLGERLWISASCSLLHVPIDLALETRMTRDVREWLAFATQKLREIAVVKRALDEGEESVAAELDAASQALASRRRAPRAHVASVREQTARLDASERRRAIPAAQRVARQREMLGLPLLPTTTIGSFPQTAHIRMTRADYRRGRIETAEYAAVMQAAIRDAIARQEAIGLDVLVHGEPERNDMVEYFAEHLEGFAVSEHGWVQSYGSRCVKPPIICGDISRPRPITLEWMRYACGLTTKPVKGMLTGPVTILCWSFVRDDLPRSEVALQLAVALREEVADLEAAGLSLIQIDEPALREGLPLERADWPAYLDWAVGAFRIVSARVRAETQIHTHMCYSQFNDILPAIAAMDADVITIENARSPNALADAFARFDLGGALGPGVYDIHSPRVPSASEMRAVLARAVESLPVEKLWVNPDCGLKTRGWPETEAALTHMVAVARELRAELAITGR